MVDYQSKYRLYSSGFTPVVPRIPVPTFRELYHETGRQLFVKRHDRPVHDCRADVMKNHTQLETFDIWLLSHGLRSSYSEVLACHEKQERETPSSTKSLDKLLYKVGQKGSANGDFNYPRGVCTTLECDILVADTQNHRIQVLNQFGVYKKSFGKLGSAPGEFNEPTDVVELPNGDLAVADRKNRRVQVFTEGGEFRSEFPVKGEPYSLACDRSYNLAVSTISRTVELFSGHQFQRVTSFSVPSRVKSKKNVSCPMPICVNGSNEIIVSDPADAYIKVLNFEGKLLRRFKPHAHARSLAAVPGGIHVTVLGQILIADTLNHVVNIYTDTGLFLKQVVGPTDDVGCLNALAVGPEGHLVITESSLTGDHCVKIMRYRECPCHEGKTPTSKKRTPATSPN
ncbi:hypothetical protein BaRGS_00015766 [Batillaria attramentaria]|uniref:Uncharacterized protein n=1 Tax=Batillaria attramentaria TaxID=370345 RepID=A0ABD0L111_9CAEN